MADWVDHATACADALPSRPLLVRAVRRVHAGLVPPHIIYGLQYGLAVAMATSLVVITPVWFALHESTRWVVVTVRAQAGRPSFPGRCSAVGQCGGSAAPGCRARYQEQTWLLNTLRPAAERALLPLSPGVGHAPAYHWRDDLEDDESAVWRRDRLRRRLHPVGPGLRHQRLLLGQYRG